MPAAIERIPYALHLGVQLESTSAKGATFRIDADERFMGNPILRAFHGGVICGFIECAMSLTIMEEGESFRAPRLITLTTSFLGSASVDKPLRVCTEVTKAGGRIRGVTARSFQASQDVLVAKASALFRASV